jgi:hypothetical protein
MTFAALLLSKPATGQVAPVPATPPPYGEVPSPKNDTHPSGGRTLDGNTLLYPTTFPSAFVTGTAAARAYARFLNVPDVPGPTRTHSLSLVGAANFFDFAVQLDERWAIFLLGGGTGVVGQNIPALIYEPGAFLLGGALGAAFRLGRWESSGTQLALRISGDYSYGKIIRLDPLFGPTGVTNATLGTLVEGADGEALRTPVKVIGFDLGLAAAQAFGRHLSLQGYIAFHPSWTKLEPFDFATGQKASVTTTVWGPTVGVAFAANGAREFPFAAMAEYNLTRRTAGENLLDVDATATVHTITLDLLFTGARQLQLGLFGSLELNLPSVVTRQGTSNSGNGELAGLVLRYIADPQ